MVGAREIFRWMSVRVLEYPTVVGCQVDDDAFVGLVSLLPPRRAGRRPVQDSASTRLRPPPPTLPCTYGTPNNSQQFLMIYEELVATLLYALAAVAVLSLLTLGKPSVVFFVCIAVVGMSLDVYCLS